jgi:prepilin-type N-terminal cleavage/methylation domain-containing protein
MPKTIHIRTNKGFTLVEMAVVLVILGFVLSALLLPLQAQRNQLFQSETENTLRQAQKALLGYAQANGRLPCPAIAASNGLESQTVAGNNICSAHDGFLPASTLGIQPTDSNGFAVDGWGNRLRYAVTNVNNGGAATADFITANDISTVGISALLPNLRVCSTSTGVAANACSNAPEVNYLINNAVAVIYSTGETGNIAAGGADETENLDGDIVFISHDNEDNGANGEFDHIVTWISPFVLYNAMIEAGQLH